ncbi:MAG: inositol monophosphatase family protein [Patescibacteria group bacterium]
MTERFIKQITRAAGAAVLKKFGKVGLKYTKKDAADIVTEADLAANNIIIKAIKRKYPSHAIISEETGLYQVGAEYCWIIDPLDGTRNFLHRTPLFAVMVGLACREKMELAAIYNPCTDELFFAKKGQGAFLNGKKIACSRQKIWENSWGIVGSNLTQKNVANLYQLLKHAKREKFWISALGSAGVSAMYQADGRRDWRVSRGGGLWDYAAPSLILSEAGCKVTNFQGKTWSLKDREMLAANKPLHRKLLQIINPQAKIYDS